MTTTETAVARVEQRRRLPNPQRSTALVLLPDGSLHRSSGSSWYEVDSTDAAGYAAWCKRQHKLWRGVGRFLRDDWFATYLLILPTMLLAFSPFVVAAAVDGLGSEAVAALTGPHDSALEAVSTWAVAIVVAVLVLAAVVSLAICTARVRDYRNDFDWWNAPVVLTESDLAKVRRSQRSADQSAS